MSTTVIPGLALSHYNQHEVQAGLTRCYLRLNVYTSMHVMKHILKTDSTLCFYSAVPKVNVQTTSKEFMAKTLGRKNIKIGMTVSSHYC